MSDKPGAFDKPRLLEAALYYARLGWYVLPLHNPTKGICSCHKRENCQSSGKHPRIADWEEAASADPQVIKAWWRRWPMANVGVAAGKSGLVVIDIDTYHGGAMELDAAEKLTVTSLTGGGGEHLVYAMPPGMRIGNTDKALPGGVNVRGWGGQFVAPPSVHAKDTRYNWAPGRGPHQISPAPLPPRLLELLRQSASALRLPPPAEGGVITAGGRNNALLSLAGAMRRKGMGLDAILAALLIENRDRCRPPLAAAEVEQIARSVMRYLPGGSYSPGAGPGQGAAVATLPSPGEEASGSGLEALLAGLDAAAAQGQGGKLAVEAKATDTIRLAAALDSVDLLRLEQKLRALGISQKSVERWRRALREVQQQLQQALAAPGAGEGQPASPYAVVDGRMVLVHTTPGGEARQAPICNFAARIAEEVVSEEGRHQFVLEGRTAEPGPRAFRLEIAADVFADQRALRGALVDAVGGRGVVMAGMAEHLAPAISLLTTTPPRRLQRFNRTGWQEGRFLIPGREAQGVVLHLARKLPFAIPPGGDPQRGLAALETLCRVIPVPKAAVILAFLFQPPLAQPLGWRNERYGLFIAGRSGYFKSSWAQCGMTLYGTGFLRDELLIKWGEGATRNAIMALATQAHDLPLLIDNYKPSTGDGARGFINLMHNLLEGGEKDRLTRAAELKETKPIFCWPLVTGEDVPDHDPASLARLLVVRLEQPEAGVEALLSAAQAGAAAGHLAALGGLWLDWLEGAGSRELLSTLAPQFEPLRRAWTAHLKTLQPDTVNAFRVATNLATNSLCWQALCLHPQLGEFFQDRRDAHREGLGELAGSMAQATAEALEGTRYLSALRELLGSGKAVLLPYGLGISTLRSDGHMLLVPKGLPSGLSSGGERIYEAVSRDRILGWAGEGGTAYLLPDLTRQAVERVLGGPEALGHISNKALYAQLADLQVIASSTPGKNLKIVRISGELLPVLHLKVKTGTGDSDLAPQPDEVIL